MIRGSTRPRLFTEPLAADGRGLPARTRGHELIRFAKAFGEPLRPWQKELALRGLELDEHGAYRFRIIVVLVARQNGKTMFLRVLALWRLFEQTSRLVVAAGQDRSRAFETWEDALETVEAHPVYSQRVARVFRRTNDEYFRVTDEEGNPAGRYRIKAATRSAGRGPSADLVPFDELREQTDWAGWGALSKTTMARPDGQVWAFSNAGDQHAVVLRHLRSVALADSDPSIGLFEWSAPKGADLADRCAWAAANPTMNRAGGIPESAIRTASSSDPPEVFRTEVLCEFVDILDPAIDRQAWADNTDVAASLDGLRDRVALCVDVSIDLAHVSLLAAAVGSDGRARVEVIAAWDSVDAARAELGEIDERVRPRLTGWFPSGPAGALSVDLRKLRRPQEIRSEIPSVCQSFSELVAARQVLHNGDPLLDAQIQGAQKVYTGDTWRFTRRDAGHCDAVYAAAGAVHLARQVKPRRRGRVLTPSNAAA